MHWYDALLLGVLEGLTEFIPVSSTGHLILLSSLLATDSAANETAHKTLDVAIQFGAVLAVILYYRTKLWALARGVVARDPLALRLLASLAIAFVPSALVGLALHDFIDRVLFGNVPVALALVVGGALMIGVERARAKSTKVLDDDLAAVTPRRALAIGLAQCFSLWPGASRSMTSIVGGQLVGLSTRAAAEFSFLLSIPTLGAAAVYKLYKGGAVLFRTPGGPEALAIGLVVAFVVSLIVIAAFMKFLGKVGLAPFGWYRVALGLVVFALVAFASAKKEAAPRRIEAPLGVAITEPARRSGSREAHSGAEAR